MKNKNFYYTKNEISRSKTYGYIVYKLTIYRVKNSKIFYIGETRQNSGSTCGDVGECWKVLQTNKYAPKKIDVFKNMFLYIKTNNINIQQI